MAPLLNARHEKFARAIAAGKTQPEAYREAGYPGGTKGSAEAAGCRLLKSVKVKAQIAELQEAAARPK